MRTCCCDHSGTCLGCKIMLEVERRFGHHGTIWLESVYRAAALHEVLPDLTCLELQRDADRLRGDDI